MTKKVMIMQKIKTTIVKLEPIKVLTPNGFSHGLVTKRSATTREVRHIMKNILGIDVNDRDCFEFHEDYKEYNNELTQNFNVWLNGDADDQCIMNYAFDCSDEQIGLFNAFKMAEYLQKRGVI